MKITPTNIKKINTKFLESLKVIEKEFGLNINTSNVKYDEDGMFKMTLTCKTNSFEKDNWERYAELFGLKKDIFGKKYIINGKDFTIVGLNTKSKKYPVIAVDNNGEEYGLSVKSFN